MRKKKRPGAGAQGLLRVTHRADEISPAGVIDLLHADCSTSNATNVGAANAEIAQFAIAHAVKFSYGLTILAPVVQRACNVHGLILVSVRRLLGINPASFSEFEYKRFIALQKQTKKDDTYALNAGREPNRRPLL